MAAGSGGIGGGVAKAAKEAKVAAATKSATAAAVAAAAKSAKAGGLLRTNTQLTLTLFLLPCVTICAFTLKVSHAPNSVDCVFSMTLLHG